MLNQQVYKSAIQFKKNCVKLEEKVDKEIK